MPHERLGEGVCAYVIADGEAPSPQALAAHIADSGLAKQKIPERFEFREDFRARLPAKCARTCCARM
ncbi:hypothetical protein ACFSLT_24560 [Novosphingobium resinovorum]